ncbi:hypothetical protein ACIGEH_18875, partial [Bacillus altitudinis]|uniref:hypothetical protein n=1 Tax=Bacillus altitudinis TaxID=293387 RepID=UPI0037CA5AA0
CVGGLFHSISSIIITMKIKKIVEKHEFLYNLTRKSFMDFLVFFNKTINIVKRMPMSKIVLVLKYQ